MKILKKAWKLTAVMMMLVLYLTSMTVWATGVQSTDNSLATLGIEDAQVTPEFYYSTTEYEVKVPAGTKTLKLDPQPTNVNAEIVSITGNELNNGTGTVTITVAAENGNQAVYTLRVTVDETKEAVTEATEQAQNVAETTAPEQSQPEMAVQDDTITNLNKQMNSLNEKLNLSMKILYGMIAFTVFLLFIIINMALKNKDLKDDLREAENALDFNTNEFARKEKTLSSDYYYAPVPEMQPDSMDAPGVEMEKVQEKTEQVFGNAQAKAQIVPPVECEKEEKKSKKKPERKSERKSEKKPEMKPEMKPELSKESKEETVPKGNQKKSPRQKEEKSGDIDVTMIDL